MTLPRLRPATWWLVAAVLTVLAVLMVLTLTADGPTRPVLAGRTLHGYDAHGREQYRLALPAGLHLTSGAAAGATTDVLAAGDGATLVLRSGLEAPARDPRNLTYPPSQLCTEWVAALGRTADPAGGVVPMATTWVADGIMELGSAGRLGGVCAPKAGLAIAYLQPERYTAAYRSQQLSALARSVRLAPHFDEQPGPVPTTTTVPAAPSGMLGMPGGVVPGPSPVDPTP